MKINEIQINGFGKLSNKSIKLDNNINIIYGKNEAGKSTLLCFINSIFYGLNKNKNGKEISDFEKYIPWTNENFSGKVSIELDNGEKYEIFRDFRKKNPIIYNKNKQDISLNYPIDKNSGIDFIFNEVRIDQHTFNNTVCINQNDVKLQRTDQNEIIQKISNIVSTGNEKNSYKKAIEKINKLQLEEIGTDRTKERPINILNDKIDKLFKSKERINRYKDFLEENNLSIDNLQKKINDEEIKLSLYRVIKESNEKKKIKNSEIKVIENIRDECFNKIEELDEKIDKRAKEKIKNEKKSSLVSIFLILVCVVSSILLFIFNNNKFFSLIFIISSLFILIAELLLRIKFNKNKKNKLLEIEDLERKIKHEIDILKKNIKSHQVEIDIKLDEIRIAENEVNRLVMNSFEDKLSSEFIEEAFDLENSKIEDKIVQVNDIINNYKIEISAKINQKEYMLNEINDLSKVQEEIDELEKEKRELFSLNNSYNLAIKGLEKAYESMRNSISPEFSNKLSKIVSKISNEKYREINFFDTNGLVIQIEDGRFLPVERLSLGTVYEMYFGLRLAINEIVSNENLPIFLDETFAFFDDNRLNNVLEFIHENSNDKQIIIFTCTKREIEALNKLNIDYNFVDLEK